MMQYNTKLENVPTFGLHLFKPKYFGTWVLFGILWIMRFLPRRWVMRMGAFIGDQMYKRNSKRRNIALINLQWCFPELTKQEREQMLMQHYRVFGATMVDLGSIWWSSQERLSKLIECPDETRYKEMASNNKIILFTPHVVALDAGGRVIARNGKGVTMMKRDKNELLSWQLYQSRSRFNGAMIVMRDQGLKTMLRAVKDGKPLYYMPDEDFGDAKFTVFAPFFGVQTSTINMLARLAKLTGAICVPCMTRLDLNTGRYTFLVGEALTHYPSGDELQDVASMNHAMESMLRQAPEQYMWTFKWFKTRPDGQSPPY